MNAIKILLVVVLVATGTVALSETPQDRREVETVFDRNKGKIYALYARALKDTPRLAGKVVLDFTIARSGDVTDCRVLSSTLGAPDLERAICERVRTMKFSPRPSELKMTKPVDFFPAG